MIRRGKDPGGGPHGHADQVREQCCRIQRVVGRPLTMFAVHHPAGRQRVSQHRGAHFLAVVISHSDALYHVPVLVQYGTRIVKIAEVLQGGVFVNILCLRLYVPIAFQDRSSGSSPAREKSGFLSRLVPFGGLGVPGGGWGRCEPVGCVQVTRAQSTGTSRPVRPAKSDPQPNQIQPVSDSESQHSTVNTH